MKIFTTLALIAPLVCFSADLTTVTGKTYKNYSVRRVTEKGIQIMHAQGGCIVPFEQLPDDVRAKYRSQEEKILAEQRQKKLEEEKQERLRKQREERKKQLKNLFVPVQKKTPETEKPQLSRHVQKEIIPAVDRESMLQIKILTPDWSNPTSDMLDGMVENDLIKPWILPMVDGMQKYYPPKWDMSLLKKAGKCVFEKSIMRNYYKSDEPGQWYIAGKITPEIAKISLIFQVDKWEDRYEFVIYASENEAHVENAKGFYLAALKFYDLSKRYKSGSTKSKREEIKIVRGEYGFGAIDIDFYNMRRVNVPFRLAFYCYSGRKEKNEMLYIKMSGKQFYRLSLAMLYAFDKLANHHLKRHYWVRNKQAGQKNNNAAK